MTTKCPIETLRDLILAGETPRIGEVEGALRASGADRSILGTMRQRGGRYPLHLSTIRRLVVGILQPQTAAISGEKLVQIPHIGKVS